MLLSDICKAERKVREGAVNGMNLRDYIMEQRKVLDQVGRFL